MPFFMRNCVRGNYGSPPAVIFTFDFLLRGRLFERSVVTYNWVLWDEISKCADATNTEDDNSDI